MQERTFGSTIASARKELKLSRRVLSEQTGISAIWIQRLESQTFKANGKTRAAKPSLETIKTLSRALRLNYHSLAIEAGYTEEELNHPRELEALERAIKCLSSEQISLVLSYTQGILDASAQREHQGK